MEKKQGQPQPDKRIQAMQKSKSGLPKAARLEESADPKSGMILTPAEVIDFIQGTDS